MNLLLDIGNTRIKWAWSDEGDFTPGGSLEKDKKAFKDLVPAEWLESEQPQRVIVSSVAGVTFTKSVRTWVKRAWRVDCEVLVPTAESCGVTNAYIKPDRLGTDRWAALIAAHDLYQAPVCLVDCGSAVTVDAIAADGRHLGGLIVPGLDMMERALTSKTSGIKMENEASGDVSLLARDTETAVQGGALYALVSLIDRVYSDLGHELGGNARRVITGGDAGRILPLLTSRPDHQPHLVLLGLDVYARETACVT
jgi:type III pantothenate kinase